jgi:hypothetical protein
VQLASVKLFGDISYWGDRFCKKVKYHEEELTPEKHSAETEPLFAKLS